MPLPTDWLTLFQVVGIGVLVFLAARSRPAPTQNGGMVQALLAQNQDLTRERDEWRQQCQEKDSLIARIEARTQELERDGQMYRRTIRQLNEDADRRQQLR